MLPRPPIAEEPRVLPSRNFRSHPLRPLPAPPLPPKSPLPSLSINTLPLKIPARSHTQRSSATSHSHQRHYHPSILLTIDTSSKILNPSSHPPTKHALAASPVSPMISQIPTPRTARQRRILKLQKYLGERIPRDLVPLAPIPTRLQSVYEWENPQSLGGSGGREGRLRSPSPAALIAENLRAFEDEKTLSDAQHDDLDEGEELWDPKIVHYVEKNAEGSRSSRAPGHDTQWLWEKEGRRWEVDNPCHVVNALRSL